MLFLFANYWVNLKFSEIVKIMREKLDQKKTKTSTKITKVLEVLSFITSVVQWIWFENSNTYRPLSIRTGSKRLFKKIEFKHSLNNKRFLTTFFINLFEILYLSDQNAVIF